MFGVRDRDTITRWRRDARVKARVLKIIEDRILQVDRRVTSVIAGRLQNADKMSIPDLLAIRKEFVGGRLRAQSEKADDETIGEAMDWLEENPQKADQLDELLRTGELPGVEAEEVAA